MAKAEPTIQTVTMDDARIVDFPGKRRMLKDTIFQEDGSIAVRIDFVNGETRIFALPESLLAKFAAHGAEQKLGDEVAGLDDVEDMVQAIDELTERLNKGEWSVRRESSGLAGASVLAKALVEMSGKAPSEIKTFLASKSAAEKAALRSNPKLATFIAKLEANKKKKGPVVDSEALLDALM